MFVDTDSLLKPLLSGLAVNRDIVTQVAMVHSVMLSRPNLEKVAEKTGLLVKAKDERERNAIIDDIAKKIRLGRPSGPGSQNTFRLTFEAGTPHTAHAVVSTLLDTFMEDSLGLKRTDSGTAQRFLESQLQEYEAKLTQAESRLADFKQENVGLMPGSGGDYFQRLETEMTALQVLQQRMNQVSQRRNELKRQLDGEEPTFGIMGSTDGSPIDGQIARYKSQLDTLLLQYTEKHPEVQAIKETIASLESEKRRGARISQSVAPPGATISQDQAFARSLDMNPVYQNLRISLSQADAEMAELRGQIGAQQAIVANLRSRVNTIPEVEAELARLNRDYNVNKLQFETLTQRLESARLSEQAEQNTENVKFRVIEPPTAPTKPSGPPRDLFNTAALLASLCLGAGLAFALSQLHPTFATRDSLQKLMGIPVLGSVTVALPEDTSPWYQRQPYLVAGALTMLLFVYAINILLGSRIQSTLLGFVN